MCCIGMTKSSEVLYISLVSFRLKKESYGPSSIKYLPKNNTQILWITHIS
jgi:hypothetical protein